ncbi:MAG TPA: hypothetical protein VGS13_07745 [Stellaceae bacterium]|nr:hypothetical protein [Stellaceae bacterium]
MLSSYDIMRPIRDEMGVAGGVRNLQWLFTGTLVGMVVLNPPFAYLVKITSTFLYFQQAGIVSKSFADRGGQTAFFATVDLLVNTLTLVAQLFFTGRILVFLGVALTLAFLPLLTMIGFGALVFAPTLSAIAVFQILRRPGDYAIARPTREIRFTVVPREHPFVYRLGDQLGAWGVAGLRALGAGATELAPVALPIALLWLLNALWLGRRPEARAEAEAAAE